MEEGGPQKTTEYLNDRDRDTRIMESLETERKNANDIQVGGKHYKSSYQHWDFVRNMELDYFEGCATKYITRRKGRRDEDLQKAIHFLLKRHEYPVLTCGDRTPGEYKHLSDFCLANGLSYCEYMAIKSVCEKRYEEAVRLIELIRKEQV